MERDDDALRAAEQNKLDPAETATPETSAEPPRDELAADLLQASDTGTPEEQPAQHHTTEAGPGTALRIEIEMAEGDLMIRGIRGASGVHLLVDGEPGAVEPVVDLDGILRVSRLADGTEVRLPQSAQAVVRRVRGDLTVENLDGLLVAQRVGGDAELDHVALADLARVEGTLQVSHSGSMRIGTLHGDARLDDIEGTVMLGRVGGDLAGTQITGLAIREALGGEVSLKRCGEVSLLGPVGGDLHVQDAYGTVRASIVGGDVRIFGAMGVTFATIGGDLKMGDVHGAIEVSTVGGHARLRAMDGPVRLGTVGSDLSVEDASLGVSAERVSGDALLDTPLGGTARYSVSASGDITLRVRGDIHARFVAQTAGGEIRTQLPLTVERGRRRNLVGVMGRGDATVTLRSDGGDISIAAVDKFQEGQDMGDDFVGRGPDGEEHDDNRERTWEGAFGRHRFRVRWDRGPGRANFRFQGPFTENEDPDATGESTSRDFGVEWEKGRGPRMYGEYEERLNDLREKAERVAKRAAEQAQRYAEDAARRARETDWEAVGREVRTSIERAMRDLDEAFSRVRHDWETRRPGGQPPTGEKPSGAQRVRIEYDDAADAFATGYGATSAATTGESAAQQASAQPSRDDVDAQRRAILEQLRAGTISLDEAERRLNALR